MTAKPSPEIKLADPAAPDPTPSNSSRMIEHAARKVEEALRKATNP